mmetsp:Transcript_23666/g.89854  ORF Transcript_23666/g.89854 Transcript_23666/m.89854 type:complete len:270 (-) Transcript_23666:14413-15222(-)
MGTTGTVMASTPKRTTSAVGDGPKLLPVTTRRLASYGEARSGTVSRSISGGEYEYRTWLDAWPPASTITGTAAPWPAGVSKRIFVDVADTTRAHPLADASSEGSGPLGPGSVPFPVELPDTFPVALGVGTPPPPLGLGAPSAVLAASCPAVSAPTTRPVAGSHRTGADPNATQTSDPGGPKPTPSSAIRTPPRVSWPPEAACCAVSDWGRIVVMTGASYDDTRPEAADSRDVCPATVTVQLSPLPTPGTDTQRRSTCGTSTSHAGVKGP